MADVLGDSSCQLEYLNEYLNTAAGKTRSLRRLEFSTLGLNQGPLGVRVRASRSAAVPVAAGQCGPGLGLAAGHGGSASELEAPSGTSKAEAASAASGPRGPGCQWSAGSTAGTVWPGAAIRVVAAPQVAYLSARLGFTLRMIPYPTL